MIKLVQFQEEPEEESEENYTVEGMKKAEAIRMEDDGSIWELE